jgi:hypothetical protein
MVLGRQIIKNLDFTEIEPIFLERDFKDRSTLLIIVTNDISSFIDRQKLSFLL